MSGILTNGLPLAILPLTGNELIPVDTTLSSGLLPESEAVSIAQLNAYMKNAPSQVIGTADNGSTQTLTVAMIVVANADFVYHTSTGGTTPSLTFPTATAIITAMGASAAVGACYVLRVINNNSGTATMVTNTGITPSGTLTLATSTWREFLIVVTSATTVTITNIGTGTNS